ncbi:MAG: RNA polymerase sigma factor [Planctomycetota bacterium]
MAADDDAGVPELPAKKGAEAGYPRDVEAEASELMTAAKRGDREAFGHLAIVLRGRAFCIARSLVGSPEDALELTQEALLKTFRARATYREGDPFLPWFHRILRNTCFSFLRHRRRLHALSLAGERGGEETDWEIEGDEPPPAAGVELAELREAFWRGFHRLSARDREILALRHFQDLSYREIASALAIPPGTVMSRLFHARRRLREALGPHLGEELAALATAPPAGEEDGGGGS